jgi:disulfide bond formation protein DsbB
MGGEVLVFAAAAIGLVAFVLLIARSLDRTARPYALPTLALAAVSGVYMAYGSALQNSPFMFFAGFFFGAVVFGAHAHAIRWLREQGE